MISILDLSQGELIGMIKRGEITLGGDPRYMIYGTLRCKQGQRARREFRVFFANEEEAIALGFRPCGSCMRVKYRIWKAQQSGA